MKEAGQMHTFQPPFRYFVVDAFTSQALKGNPAVVVMLEEEKENEWLQGVAQEFNLLTCFLIMTNFNSLQVTISKNPRFHLRWFAPTLEVKICAHGTLSCAHILFSNGAVQGNRIEFVTQSGVLTAEKILENHEGQNGNTTFARQSKNFPIQLQFPLLSPTTLDSSEMEFVPNFINCPSILNIIKMPKENDLIIELPSSKEVIDFDPTSDEIKRWPGRAVAVTGVAPPQSGFDFFTRLFAPNTGIFEDHVCGSIHCALGPYWSLKLGKSNLKAYMASRRGGTLELQVEEKTQTVFIVGRAVTVMEGSLLA